MMTETQQVIAGLAAAFEKRAMHGYPDYQMTEPQTPPVPQMTLPNYERAEQEPPGRAFPAKAMLSGGILGAGIGAGMQQQNIAKEMERLRFLQGQAEAGAPSINMVLLDAVQRGRKQGIDVDIDALRQRLTTPQGVEEYYNWASEGGGKGILAKQIPEHRGLLGKALLKGPGLGLLGGAALGLGAGYAMNELFPEKTSGLLAKSAFRAGPPTPESYQIPDAWREFSQKREAKISPWAATMVAPAPQAATQVGRMTPSYERGGSGILKGLSTVVGKRKGILR
jgi:hypothetical protein